MILFFPSVMICITVCSVCGPCVGGADVFSKLAVDLSEQEQAALSENADCGYELEIAVVKATVISA